MTKYEGDAVIQLIKYPHGSPTDEDCGCVECEHVYLENQGRIKAHQEMNDKDLTEPLTAEMNNSLAWKLGSIAMEAGIKPTGSGDEDKTDLADKTERGLILRQLLEESGFYLVRSK